MTSLIKVYKGTPTGGGTDGTLVSEGTGLEPIESGSILIPESGYTEGSWVKLAIRCDSGYETEEASGRHARVSIVDSTHVDKWQLAPDSTGSPGTPEDWGDPLDFAAQIGATNTIFWARARAAYTETPVNDTTVDIQVAARIAAA